ncbi:MAG TPA: hypothetical protein VMH23_07545 [Bacteroidota bacterium]|nr:hypothetical protein [Bacteroidota bacterium]
MKAILRLLSLVGTLVLCAVSMAVAQDAQSQPPAPGRALERVEQYKKIRLMEVLNLDEQGSIKFFARYNKYQEQLRDIRKQQVAALGQVQSLRKSQASDAEYNKTVDELLSLERQLNDAKSKYVEELKQVLTSKQIAEYLVFEVRFQQNLRELARDFPRNRQQQMSK